MNEKWLSGVVFRDKSQLGMRPKLFIIELYTNFPGMINLSLKNIEISFIRACSFAHWTFLRVKAEQQSTIYSLTAAISVQSAPRKTHIAHHHHHSQPSLPELSISQTPARPGRTLYWSACLPGICCKCVKGKTWYLPSGVECAAGYSSTSFPWMMLEAERY